MTDFLTEDFLLSNDVARRLYHQFAAAQPILDYHCHLSPCDVAENRRFANLFEIWLEGDHYKWRAMRANGVPEKYITGDATPYEKFLAWAGTVPYTLRNPLYHWTHLELQRYFGIHEVLDETSAPSIWERANAVLAQGLTAQAILQKFHVEVVCTTDDPTDDLRHHRAIANSELPAQVFPAFRPDKALAIGDAEFLPWIEKLSQVANVNVRDLSGFLQALRNRHDSFHALGCRLSDHGLNHCYAAPCSERAAAVIFAKARDGRSVTDDERTHFASFMMLFFGRIDAEKGWTKQLHLGALRNVNAAARRKLGADAGYDMIGDFPQASDLAAYLDLLSQGERSAADDPVQREPGRHLSVRDPDWLFSGRRETGKDPIRQRLVVPRPEAGHHGATRCLIECWAAVAVHRHGHRLAVVHVLSPPRIFPASALRPHRPGRREGRTAQ